MKDYRFYLEYPDNKAKRIGTVAMGYGEHSGTIVAANLEKHGHSSIQDKYGYEGLVAVYDRPDSDVNWGFVSQDYLREKCRRIPEALARTIHPRLFERLDEK